MSTRVPDPQPPTAADRRALTKLQVLKVVWNPFGSHFILGNTNLRLSDFPRAAAALRKLLPPLVGCKPEKLEVDFFVNADNLFEMKVQLPGGVTLNFSDDEVRALLDEYLDPKLTGVANPSIEVVRAPDSGRFLGLMAHILVVRGEPKTLETAVMLAVPGVSRVTVQEAELGHRAIIRARVATRDRARFDSRDRDQARATVRALCAALGLEVAVADDIIFKDPRPELALFDGDAPEE